ncbi:MAG: ABC transporter permease [Anaerolineae bacterium]|nr:ABC transporter permease [Anaerolineae bacterium]
MSAGLHRVSCHDRAPARVCALRRWMRGALPLVVVALLWELAPRSGLVDAALLPPLSRTLAAGIGLVRSGALLGHLWASVWRVGAGYLLAVLVAVPAGIGLGLSRRLEGYVSPVLALLRPISPPAWVPLAILWFGIGDAPAIFIVFVGTVQAILIGIASTARSVDRRLVQAALTLGATRRQAIRLVVLPCLGPAIFGQLRVGLALAWMCVMAAEMVAVRRGLGYLLIEARNLFQTERVLLCMVIIGALGLGLDRLLRTLEGMVLRWQRGMGADELFAAGRGKQDLSR